MGSKKLEREEDGEDEILVWQLARGLKLGKIVPSDSACAWMPNYLLPKFKS